MIFGPLENSHVARYKTALENFPLSFQREKWSKGETQHLEKEIVKQFQESLFQRSADVLRYMFLSQLCMWSPFNIIAILEQMISTYQIVW